MNSKCTRVSGHRDPGLGGTRAVGAVHVLPDWTEFPRDVLPPLGDKMDRGFTWCSRCALTCAVWARQLPQGDRRLYGCRHPQPEECQGVLESCMCLQQARKVCVCMCMCPFIHVKMVMYVEMPCPWSCILLARDRAWVKAPKRWRTHGQTWLRVNGACA